MSEADKNLVAFLDTIAASEGTRGLGHQDGYDILVGSVPGKEIRIGDLSRHPFVRVELNPTLWSTAAGRYQIIHPTWTRLVDKLGLTDFSPASQDRACIELIDEHKALDNVRQGHIAEAFNQCRREWASLPGSNWNQHEHKMAWLLQFFRAQGGVVND